MKSFYQPEKRIIIIAGHYGTGKTELAVNLVLRIAEQGYRTCLADLDNVNPYFRSRERRDVLEAKGIRVICSSAQYAMADMPTLPPELPAVFQDPTLHSVLDIGGDPVGARVLKACAGMVKREACDFYYVANANQPEVNTPEKAERNLRMIEEAAGLSFTGIANNTHLCRETTIDDLNRGEELGHELARRTGLPLVFCAVEEVLLGKWKENGTAVFPVRIFMRKPWEVEKW